MAAGEGGPASGGGETPVSTVFKGVGTGGSCSFYLASPDSREQRLELPTSQRAQPTQVTAKQGGLKES